MEQTTPKITSRIIPVMDDSLPLASLEGLSIRKYPDQPFVDGDIGLTEMLQQLMVIPPPVGPENNKGAYHPWGFPIYRTAYGGSTDRLWEELIEKIRCQVLDEIEVERSGQVGGLEAEAASGSIYTSLRPFDRHKEAAAVDNAARHLRSLFTLEPRSDRKLLEGADLDRVRQIYRDEIDDMPFYALEDPYRLILVADAEVMAAVSRGDFWIKCVQPEYKAEDYIPRNTRLPQRLGYLGYMWMTTRSLLRLWDCLLIHGLDEIAPRLDDGKLTKVWNGGE